MPIPFKRFWRSFPELAVAGLLCIGVLHEAAADEPKPVPAAETRRELRVVADDNYPPFLFRDTDQRVHGYLVDYWDLWSRKTGVSVQLVAMNWAQAQSTIRTGGADVIDMIFRTAPREPLYDFSPPYADLPVNIYHHASISGLTGADTLRGFRVGVMDGDACIDQLAAEGITELARYPNYDELIRAADREEVKVFCLDEIPANFYFYRLGVRSRFHKAFTLYTGHFHRAVRKGDADTLRLVVSGMAAITPAEDAALREKWFGAPIDLGTYARRALWIALAAGALGLALVLWNLALRRTVGARTRELTLALDELREANRSALESQANLGATLAAIPDLMFEFDAEARYLAVFASQDALLAAPAEALGGRPVEDVLPAAAAAVVRQAVASALAQGNDYGRTIELPLSVGTRWFELSAARKASARGGPPTVMLLSRDITRRREAELEVQKMRSAALAAERDRVFRMLFESSPVAMVHCQGEIIEAVNRQFTLQFGWELDAIPTLESWWTRAYPDPLYRSALQHDWQAALELASVTGDATPPRDVRVTCADGSVRDTLIAVQPVARGIVASFVDVTDLKRGEADLRMAKQAAEQANLAKSAFLANMSHEIRTPLNGIIGMAHLIRQAGLSAEQESRLGKLEVAASHLLQILNAILDLSKIEAGKLTLERRPLRIEAVVAETLSIVELTARKKGLELVSDVQACPRLLVGDATRLQQALLNYVNNAIKFTARGRVAVRAAVLDEDADSALLRFEVEDTGIGIEHDVLERLFISFQQADVSTTRRYGGTGLGLTITRRMAELMGGDAGAESTPGVGSRFWFTARLGKATTPAGESAAVQPVESALSALRQRHAGARILLVEDNAINAEVAAALLQNAGLTVDVAVDGASAVAKAEQATYALVLMDVQMPGMDGIEASRRIIALRPQMRIVAMTANAFAEDRAACLGAGMCDFIGKPVDPERFYATLLLWLERGRPGGD